MSHHTEPEKGAPVTFQVDGRSYAGAQHEGLLGALRRLGFEVPSLCFHEAVSAYGACRLCLVEVQKGRKRRVTTSCNYPVSEGLQVFLDTPEVQRHRRVVLQLLLAKSPASPEVRALAAEHGVLSTPYATPAGDEENKCILCGLCNRVCSEIVGAHAIDFAGRGLHKRMESPYDETAEACIGCGACVYVCPTKCIGISEQDHIRQIHRWHRELPMQACKKCGQEFFPTFMLMAFAKRIKVERSHFDVCQNCR